MKTYTKNPIILSVLIVTFGLLSVGQVPAQTFTTLHHFTGFDGASPEAGFILSGNTLYGTASNGGGAGGPGPNFHDAASFHWLRRSFSGSWIHFIGQYLVRDRDRKSTRLNSSHIP